MSEIDSIIKSHARNGSDPDKIVSGLIRRKKEFQPMEIPEPDPEEIRFLLFSVKKKGFRSSEREILDIWSL